MSQKSLQHQQMRLYGRNHDRYYINAVERARFIAATKNAYPSMASLGLTLLYTGCRISEALALTCGSVQAEERIITFRTLKRRNLQTFREVPVPPELIKALTEAKKLDMRCSDQALWMHLGRPLNRITAYRWIKILMADADIWGAQACPKGLRHGFGIHAQHSGVPLNMLQKWMGHADMSTTAIYADASGAEERAIAGRMWYN